MSFALIIYLVLFIGVALALNKRKMGFSLVALTLLWILYVGGGTLPTLLMNHLQARGPLNAPVWKSKNVIIVLGAGTAQWPENGRISSTLLSYSRVHEATRLYFDCKKKAKNCQILPSGGDPLKHQISEAETMGKEFKEAGVPETDLILESKSNNTYQNAQFSNDILRSQAFDQIILVTSGVHMSRSLLYFSQFQIYPTAAPSDYLDVSSSFAPLSFNFLLTDLALHEYKGILRFHVYNKLGWNSVKSLSRLP